MKTVSKQQAGKNFLKVADLAHGGETVMITHDGQPWCKIIPANGTAPRRKSAADFQERLEKIFPKPLSARAMSDFVEGR